MGDHVNGRRIRWSDWTLICTRSPPVAPARNLGQWSVTGPGWATATLGHVVELTCLSWQSGNLELGRRGPRLRGNDEEGRWKISTCNMSTAPGVTSFNWKISATVVLGNSPIRLMSCRARILTATRRPSKAPNSFLQTGYGTPNQAHHQDYGPTES